MAPPTRQQRQQHREQKAAKKAAKQKAPKSVWDVNENDVDSDDDDEWRKKSVMADAKKRKSFINYGPVAPPKPGAFNEERRKSVFDESSSDEDSSDDDKNGRRLTVDVTNARNPSVSGMVNFQ